MESHEKNALDWEPIRVAIFPMNIYEDEQGKYLIQVVLEKAKAKIQGTLNVRRAKGTLKLARPCLVRWSGGMHAGKCQSYGPAAYACMSSGLQEIPHAHIQEQEVCPTPSECQILAGGPGIPDADLALYVNIVDCGLGISGTQAYATACNMDENDKPVSGVINFCNGRIDTRPEKLQEEVQTALHEIIHVLGFSFDRIPFYRFPDGKPRTERGPNGRPLWRGDYRDILRPDSINRKIAEEHGLVKIENRTGTETVFLSLPSVTSFVKQHFGCADAPGAALERTGGDGTAGSHWEDSFFRFELMTGRIKKQRTVLSGLTLALLEDTGWYRTQPEQAEILHWGKGSGCTLFAERCLQQMEQFPAVLAGSIPGYFCESKNDQCTWDFQGFGRCLLPEEAMNFSLTASELDSLNSFLAETCPVVKEYTDSDCTVELSDGVNRNYLGETYGVESRCFHNAPLANKWRGTRRPGCYKRACVQVDNASSLQMYVWAGNKLVNCTAGGKHTVEGFQNDFECPDPIFIPRYCRPSHRQEDWAPFTSVAEIPSAFGVSREWQSLWLLLSLITHLLK